MKEDIKVLEHCLEFYKKFCEDDGLQPIITGKEVKSLTNLLKYINQIDKIDKYIEDRISVLTVSIDNKAKDQYFNNKCIGGVRELKYIRCLLNKGGEE